MIKIDDSLDKDAQKIVDRIREMKEFELLTRPANFESVAHQIREEFKFDLTSGRYVSDLVEWHGGWRTGSDAFTRFERLRQRVDLELRDDTCSYNWVLVKRAWELYFDLKSEVVSGND